MFALFAGCTDIELVDYTSGTIMHRLGWYSSSAGFGIGSPCDNVCFTSDGRYVLATGVAAACVFMLRVSDGGLERTIATDVLAPGSEGLALTRSGEVVVADRGGRRVQVFNADGSMLVRMWCGQGCDKHISDNTSTSSVCVANNHVYVKGSSRDMVTVLSL